MFASTVHNVTYKDKQGALPSSPFHLLEPRKRIDIIAVGIQRATVRKAKQVVEEEHLEKLAKIRMDIACDVQSIVIATRYDVVSRFRRKGFFDFYMKHRSAFRDTPPNSLVVEGHSIP